MDAEKYISGLNMFGIRLGLERVRELASLAGNPEKELKFIHLAGTNGKGSTGAMLECVLRNLGYTTGFYSSPHLIDTKERFRINGRAVNQELFEAETEKLAELSRDNPFTYFEFVTILALQIFKAAKCDFVIWETGMGGRLDATNIVTPECCIITNIALDHQDHLGDSTSKIAAEKAGIFKPGIPVFYGKLDESAKEVIERQAEKLGCPVTPPAAATPQNARIFESASGFIQEFDYCGSKIRLSLAGEMQRENFRIVHNVLKFLAGKYGFDFVRSLTFLDRVVWPARFQKVNSRIIVDGGHNPDGAAALLKAVTEFCPQEKFCVIFAAFEDKCVDDTVKMLSRFAGEFIFTRPTDWGRAAHSFENLKKLVPETIPCRWCDNASGALELALKGSRRVLACGSLYLAGKVLELVNGKNSACDLVSNPNRSM